MIALGFIFIVLGIAGILGGLHEWEEFLVTFILIVIGAVILRYYWH